MMKRILFFFLVLLAFTSCGEDVIKTSFRIEPKGFSLVNTIVDTIDLSASFVNKYSGGVVTFSDGQHSYDFYTGKVSISEFIFELPVGEYTFDCYVDIASYYGQSGGSFNSLSKQIIITDSTETIPLDVEATCSLFLVNDPDGNLSDPPSIIRRRSYSEGYFQSFPMKRDTTTGLYYAYFTPDPEPEDPTAFLWFYQNIPGVESGGLSTVDLSLGKIYQFEIYE